LFANILAHKVLFLLVEVKGLVMAVTSSESVISLGTRGGARTPNCIGVVVVLLEFVLVGEDVEVVEFVRWLVEIPWKPCITGTSPAFCIRWASRLRAADIILSSPIGMVSSVSIAS